MTASLGENDLGTAQSLNNLANLYQDQGLYGRAEPLYQRALAIREAALGKNHSRCRQFAQQPRHPLQGAGIVRPGRAAPPARTRHPGSGPRQEPSRRRHLAQQPRHPLREAGACTAGPSRSFSARSPSGKRPSARNHPDVAASLNNLANLYGEQGLYSRAEPLLPARARHPGSGPRREPSRPSPTRSTTSPTSTWSRGCTAGPSRSPARARHPGSGPRREPSQRRHLAQQPRHPLPGPGAVRPGPDLSASARSPSGKRPSARNIPTSPARSTPSPPSTWPRGG